MIPVFCRTNIDAYKGQIFPDKLHTPPHKGEFVWVKKELRPVFESKRLPIRLEVVQVEHNEDGVRIELWYNDLDRRVADTAGAKTL